MQFNTGQLQSVEIGGISDGNSMFDIDRRTGNNLDLLNQTLNININ
jgi:hypothetical protein